MSEKLEKLKEELSAKEARLAEIEAILDSVKELEKEVSALSGKGWRGNSHGGQIGVLKRDIADEELRLSLVDTPAFYFKNWRGDKVECNIKSIDEKFITVIDKSLHIAQFRTIDGLPKGKRKDTDFTNTIDVKAAIEAFNNHKSSKVGG